MAYRGDHDLEARLRARLDPLEFGPGWGDPPPFGDYDLNPHWRPRERPILKPAAVLVAIIQRSAGATVLLTQRAQSMPTHAGQVAFPGGRIGAGDDGPVGAALREAYEEVGLAASFVEPIGAMPPYETVSGYTVAPIVALVRPGFSLTPDPREVEEIFEAPCAFLFDPANHQRHERPWQDGARAYYVMPFEDRFIWGATAGMLKALYHRLYDE